MMSSLQKVFFIVLITVLSSCDDESDTGIPCAKDNVCQPACQTDPDCKNVKPAVNSGGSSAPATNRGTPIQTILDDSGDPSANCPKGSLNAKSSSDLRRFTGCPIISGDLVVENTSVGDFGGLETISAINGSLIIKNNNSLRSLAGLNAVTEISGNVVISYNKQLKDIDALAGLTKIGGRLEVRANASLPQINGLISVTSVGGELYIRANTALNSLVGLDSLNVVNGDIKVGQNTALWTCQVQNLLQHIRTQGQALVCENKADGCGTDSCPDVW